MKTLSEGKLGERQDATGPTRIRPALVSNATFWLYMFFLVDYFAHLSSRVPAYGMIRPTLLLVVFITCMLLAQSGILKKRKSSPVFRSLLVLVAYLMISWPLVAYPGSIIRANLPAFVKAMVFFYFTAFIIDSPKRLKIFIFIFVTLQVIRGIEPLILHITSGYWGSATYIGDGESAERLAGAPSDVVNPNGLGFVIATAIPFLHYLLYPRGILGKILYLGLGLGLLYALILTMSRGAFIALLVVVAIIFRNSKHKAVLAIVILGIMVAGWSVMTPMQQDRYLSLINKSETANQNTKQGRLDGMVGEFMLGLSRPIVGHGLGNTQEAKFLKTGGVHVSHNLYAELIIEIGFVGLAIFLYFLFSIFRSLYLLQQLFRIRKIPMGTFAGQLLQALTTVFWMYVVYSINYWGLSQSYWYLFGGIVFALHRLVGVYFQQTPSAVEPSHSSVQLK